jgi:hypothetical protein
MSQLANQWIDLFRAGSYGDKGDYSEQDLQQIVDNYKPSFHEAPACIGHPKEDAPAYGWWEQLRRVGDVLQGKLKPNVDPTFEELVKSGRFDKRSVALYKGGEGFSLRHVAFLGAQPPEIKGLAALKFGEQDKKAIEIEFSEEKQMPETTEQQVQRTFMESLTAFFESRFGKSVAIPAAATFSESDVKRIATETATAAVAAAVAPMQVQLDSQKATFSETQTAQQELEQQRKVDAAILRVKAKGAWVPAFDKMKLPLVFSALAASTVTIEFGEGADKKNESALDTFTTFMEGLGQIVPAGAIDISRRSTAKPEVGRVNDGGRHQADPNSIRFAEAVKAYQEEHKVSYEIAMGKVAQKNPELTVAGGVAAGAV